MNRWIVNRFLRRWNLHCHAQRRYWNAMAEHGTSVEAREDAEQLAEVWRRHAEGAVAALDWLWAGRPERVP